MSISINNGGSPAPLGDRAQLREAAKNFEAIFLRQMLSQQNTWSKLEKEGKAG